MNTFNKVCAAFMAAVMLCLVQPHGATIVVRGPVIAAAAGGSPSLVASTSAGGTANSCSTSSIDTTGANLLIAVVSYYPPSGTITTSHFSDNKSNTWSALTASEDTYVGVRIFYVYGGTVGSGHTTSVSLSASYSSIIFLAFSGMASSPLDQQNGAVSSGLWSTLNPGSITPSQANTLSLAVLGYADNVGSTTDIGDSYNSTLIDVTWSSGNHQGVAAAWKVLTSATAQNPQWSNANNDSGAARITSFKY